MQLEDENNSVPTFFCRMAVPRRRSKPLQARKSLAAVRSRPGWAWRPARRTAWPTGTLRSSSRPRCWSTTTSPAATSCARGPSPSGRPSRPSSTRRSRSWASPTATSPCSSRRRRCRRRRTTSRTLPRRWPGSQSRGRPSWPSPSPSAPPARPSCTRPTQSGSSPTGTCRSR